jgi:RNA polymerase sigma-70 factor (ECF subfamily)
MDVDNSLVARARRDPCAFAGLYDRYLRQVYRYLYSRVGDRYAVEDLTSQVFLAALEAFPRYQHDGHFAAWLMGIASRKLADYYRESASQVPLEHAQTVPAPDENPLEKLVRSEEMSRLAHLVGGLKDPERELLNLRFAARLSFLEIARLLKRKESAVKMALYRLLERLERQMEAEDE